MRKGIELGTPLREAIERHPGYRYKLAIKADISPSVLSAWLHGRDLPLKGDRRVLRLGKLLGIAPERCFADDEAPGASAQDATPAGGGA